MAGKEISLKKGDILFKEGDASRALYLVKSGILRIFKSKVKGDQIEIGTVKSSEMIGEMAFIDGSPRSASVESLQDTTVIEIDFETLKKYIETQPPWFSGMLRSITGRLREANNRIKQLEGSAVSISYKKDASGKMESQFEYFTTKNVASFLISLQRANQNNVIEISTLKKYYQYLLEENPTKILELVNFFAEHKILDLSEFKDGGGVIKIQDANKLNSYLDFLATEKKKEEEAQFQLSKTAFTCLELIQNCLVKNDVNVKVIKDEKKPNDPAITKVEIYHIIKQLKQDTGKNVILDNFSALKKNGFFEKEIEVVSPTEAYLAVDPPQFLSLFPNLKIHYELKILNEVKTSKIRGK